MLLLPIYHFQTDLSNLNDSALLFPDVHHHEQQVSIDCVPLPEIEDTCEEFEFHSTPLRTAMNSSTPTPEPQVNDITVVVVLKYE